MRAVANGRGSGSGSQRLRRFLAPVSHLRGAAAGDKRRGSSGRVWAVASHTHFRPDDYDGPQHDEIVVLEAGDHRTAFVVDEVIAEQEVLVKNLGTRIRRVRHVSGATLLSRV